MTDEFNDLTVNSILPDVLTGGPFPDELFRINDLLPIPEHPDIIAISWL